MPRLQRHAFVTESADELGRARADDRALIRARRVRSSLLFGGILVAALYIGLPRIAGLDETWGRLSTGDPIWLGLALLLEVASYAGYVLLFRGIFGQGDSPLGWRESYEITLSGVAATRLFAVGGAGGIALTGWALARLGMSRSVVVSGLTTFLSALYGVYMVTLVIVGAGLRTGVLTGPSPFALTVVPALFGTGVIGVALAASLLPRDFDSHVRARSIRHQRLVKAWVGSAAAAAAVAAGVRGALALLRDRDPVLIGAVAWWGFDIGVLWACFHAFGAPPPPAVLVMAYFTGMIGNLLPLPGGVGGVEGGMIAALIGFNVTGGLAVVAVLSYRVFSFLLPTVPGAIAYLQLRRTIDERYGTASCRPRG